LWDLPVEQQETFHTYPLAEQYTARLREYVYKQHAPLMKELNSQTVGQNAFTRSLLKIYNAWESTFRTLELRLDYTLLYLLLIATGILLVRDHLVLKRAEPVLALIILFVFSTSIASCAFEVFHSRYYLPAIAFEFITAGYIVKRILEKLPKA
jgi:hypothetical protein